MDVLKRFGNIFFLLCLQIGTERSRAQFLEDGQAVVDRMRNESGWYEATGEVPEASVRAIWEAYNESVGGSPLWKHVVWRQVALGEGIIEVDVLSGSDWNSLSTQGIIDVFYFVDGGYRHGGNYVINLRALQIKERLIVRLPNMKKYFNEMVIAYQTEMFGDFSNGPNAQETHLHRTISEWASGVSGSVSQDGKNENEGVSIIGNGVVSFLSEPSRPGFVWWHHLVPVIRDREGNRGLDVQDFPWIEAQLRKELGAKADFRYLLIENIQEYSKAQGWSLEEEGKVLTNDKGVEYVGFWKLHKRGEK